MNSNLAKPIGAFVALMVISSFATSGVIADSAGVTLSESSTFSEQTGEGLYIHVCQACHMDRGQGAVGAAKYPPLAKNENLDSAEYAAFVVVNGLKGMPAVGQMMSDEQVAAVVNYIRTHFGNDYPEPISAGAIADMR